MHFETVHIPIETWEAVQKAKASGRQVWALGTTVARSLEAAAAGQLPIGLLGETDLFIRPGFKYKIVDRLLTNFHQPQSTLLALVSAFASLQTTLACYQWAMERKFRLFSYGDLTAWTNGAK
jgi:S-adenosylmethionine:tRNA ribosyltransferase-isomerase